MIVTHAALRTAIGKAIRPTMLIGLQDADLSGPGGTQRINEWADWITDALVPMFEAERAITAHLAANQIRTDADLRATEGETELAEYGRELAELITPKEES